MKAIIIIVVILIALWALSYFGFIPIQMLRGECTTTGGVTGGEITGYYYMGSCAT